MWDRRSCRLSPGSISATAVKIGLIDRGSIVGGIQAGNHTFSLFEMINSSSVIRPDQTGPSISAF